MPTYPLHVQIDAIHIAVSLGLDALRRGRSHAEARAFLIAVNGELREPGEYRRSVCHCAQCEPPKTDPVLDELRGLRADLRRTPAPRQAVPARPQQAKAPDAYSEPITPPLPQAKPSSEPLSEWGVRRDT